MAIFNGIEDIRGQKLNPTKLKQQGNMMIPNYDYQNATYGLITKRVASLCEESKLKGAALEGFKYQMTTYKDVLDGLCYANELDKYDISVVNADLDAKLGDECLNGTEILDELQKAKQALEDDRIEKEKWEGRLEACEWWNGAYAIECLYNIHKYKGRMEDDQEDIDYWTERANLFVELNNELKDYFDNGFNFREAVKEGIKALRQSYDLDTNSYKVGDYSWKIGMYGMLESSVFDKDGKVNLDMVGQILSKDADAISDAEYFAVAIAYENVDVDQLDDFYNLCQVPADNDICGMIGKDTTGNLLYDPILQFTVDSKKIEGMSQQLSIHQADLLSVIKSGELSEEETKMVIEQRDGVLQRLTLLNTVGDIHTFYKNSSDDAFFNFESKHMYGDSDCIVVTYTEFVEGRGENGNCQMNQHTATVSNTLSNTGLSSFSTSQLENATMGRLTSNSMAMSLDAVGNQFVGDTVTAMTEGLSFAATGSTTAGGSVGAAVVFGLNLYSSIEKDKANQEFIADTWSVQKVVDVANYYDCTGNLVIYDDNTVDISIYEDVNTSKRAEGISDVIGQDVSAQSIVENPGEAFTMLYNWMENHDERELDDCIDDN